MSWELPFLLQDCFFLFSRTHFFHNWKNSGSFLFSFHISCVFLSSSSRHCAGVNFSGGCWSAFHTQGTYGGSPPCSCTAHMCHHEKANVLVSAYPSQSFKTNDVLYTICICCYPHLDHCPSSQTQVAMQPRKRKSCKTRLKRAEVWFIPL